MPTGVGFRACSQKTAHGREPTRTAVYCSSQRAGRREPRAPVELCARLIDANRQPPRFSRLRSPPSLVILEQRMPRLTNLRVDGAKLPPSGQAFVWCRQDRGFGIRLNASGTRTFVVQGRVEGRERRISIGRRGVFTVDQARDRAREILRDMRVGIDPVGEKHKRAHLAFTLRQAVVDYCLNKRTKNGALKARTLCLRSAYRPYASPSRSTSTSASACCVEKIW
jgi:Arm DNA-binding domain